MRQLREYRLHVKGIFGRNRKPKFESFLITETESELSIEEVESLMASKIAEIKVKSGHVKVVTNPVKIEVGESGVTYRTTTIDLSGNNVIIGWRQP